MVPAAKHSKKKPQLDLSCVALPQPHCRQVSRRPTAKTKTPIAKANVLASGPEHPGIT